MKKQKWSFRKLISNLTILFGALMIIWFSISWMEVVTHNLDKDYSYNNYNLIKVIERSLSE